MALITYIYKCFLINITLHVTLKFFPPLQVFQSSECVSFSLSFTCATQQPANLFSQVGLYDRHGPLTSIWGKNKDLPSGRALLVLVGTSLKSIGLKSIVLCCSYERVLLINGLMQLWYCTIHTSVRPHHAFSCLPVPCSFKYSTAHTYCCLLTLFSKHPFNLS